MRELTVGNRCSVRGVATFLPLPRPSSLEGTYFMCIMQNLATTLAPLPSSREGTYFIVYYAKTDNNIALVPPPSSREVT